MARHVPPPAWRSGSRTVLSLAAQLTPIIALALVFPIVGTRLAAVKFGHTSLSSVLLAAALSVPWLAQIGCAPLYRAIGEDIYNNGPDALVRSFLSRWPAVFLSSIPAVAVLDISFTIVFRWSRGASLAYLLFGVVSLALTQWFVVPVMEHRYWLWSVTWVTYALALLVAPRLYVLPPCAALVVLVTAVVRRGASGHLAWTQGVGGRLFEGAVLGNLIWVNPLIAFFALGGQFHAAQIFLSLLPAVLLYNFYFVVNAPKVSDYFEKLQHTLQDDPVRSLFAARRALFAQAGRKIASIGTAMAAVAVLSLMIEMTLGPSEYRFYGAMTLCSIGFCLEAIFVSDLVVFRRNRFALTHSTIHFLAFAGVVALWGPSARLYEWTTAVEFLILAVLITMYVREIAEPEYALFWGRATAW